MPKAIVSGHVYGLPEVRRDKNDQPFALVKIWLPPTPHSKCQNFVSAIAFIDGPFHEILALKTEDAVSIAGEIKFSIWESANKISYPSIEMVADKILALSIDPILIIKNEPEITTTHPSEAESKKSNHEQRETTRTG
ncbi:MAG: hypothetical protein PHF42_05215 [Pseudomonas sp.]|nr:hypothetical protein [Pseudomonas sp.]